MEIKKSEKVLLKETLNCYMIGTVAWQEEFPPLGEEQGQAVTKLVNSDKIIFFIKPLSDEPEPIERILNTRGISNLYIGIDNQQATLIFGLDYILSNKEEKIDIIKRKLKDRIILFKPNVTLNGNSIFKNLKIISLESRKDFYNDKFTLVPVLNINYIQLENSILKEESIELNDYSNYMVQPKYIICDNYLYYNLKGINDLEDKGRWKIEGASGENINKLKFDLNKEDIQDYIIKVNDNVVFLNEKLFKEKINIEIKNELILKNNTEILEPKEIDLREGDENILNESLIKEDESEWRFLEQFKKYTLEHNLSYFKKDLINFHISIKTNNLTILSGECGSGKTRLAISYANMLGLNKEDNTLLILPISPSYTEPGDILGYLNSTNGIYIPSESGFVDLLVHAKENPDKMHMVIFDEMNLSQVEYWFSAFMSILELDFKNRNLILYNSSICHNKHKYPNSINLGNNIIFIGTINIDETTKDLSDRLLDRTSIIEIKKMKFIDLKNEQLGMTNMNNELYNIPSKSIYLSWINNTDSLLEEFYNKELIFLDKLNEIIKRYDEKKGISFRTLKSIGKYLINIPKSLDGNKLISRMEAFDLLIRQKVLVKLKGSEQQYENLIGSINVESNKILHSKLYDFFSSEEAESISKFELTKNKVFEKAKELTIYGYTN